jgi:hypothetical protein
MKKDKEDLVKFVEGTILPKVSTIEGFVSAIDTYSAYLDLKGTIDEDAARYLINLKKNADMIMLLKSRAYNVDTTMFYPNKTGKVKKDDLILFVESTALGKSSTEKELTSALDIISAYLQLKGPLERGIEKYFDELKENSDIIMILKSRGINVSTTMFYPNELELEKEEEKTVSDYVDPCTGPTIHYGNPC